MRWVSCVVVALALPSAAFAADWDVLRGPEPVGPPSVTNWTGLYGGAQYGADFDGVDYRKVAQPYISTISALDANFNGIPLSNFPKLSALDTTKATYGAFVGYNFQFEDVVLGLELNYNRGSLNSSMTDSESHNYFQNANGTLYDATYNVSTSAAAAITNYGTVRGRVGWAFQNFLPYAFGGLSIAQVNASSSVNVNYCGQESPYSCVNPPPASTPPPPAPIGGSWTLSDHSHGKLYYGYVFGVGVDYAITQHMFVRGEVEYIEFGSPDGIRLSDASARVGAGVRF